MDVKVAVYNEFLYKINPDRIFLIEDYSINLLWLSIIYFIKEAIYEFY